MEYFFVPAMYLPDGVGFKLYGVAHLTWLAALAVMCFLMVHFYRRMDKRGRSRFAKGIAIFLLTCEVLRDVYIIAYGAWEWQYLPLHPCSFTMFIIAIWAFKPNDICGQILYGFGMVGALCALLFCNWTDQPLLQFQTIYSFIFHGLLIGFVLMALIGGDIKPKPKGFVCCVVFIAIAGALTGIVNQLLPDVNFFFTNEGSEGSPLEIFIKLFGTPWWLLAYAALAAVVIGCEFLPWRKRAVHSSQAAKETVKS